MSVADSLIILEEHSSALLQRIADFKVGLSHDSTKPEVLKTLEENKLWPLTKDNDIDPDNSKVRLSILSS